MTFRHVPAVVLAALIMSGCTGTGAPESAQSSSAGYDLQAALDTGRQFAACGRSHGYPDLPDPVIQDERLIYPSPDDAIKQQLQQVMQVAECKAIADRLPDFVKQRPAPSAQDMAKLQAFAACVREHGIPEWPDPKADGTFPIVGTPLEAEGKSQRWFTASEACKQFWDQGINAS